MIKQCVSSLPGENYPKPFFRKWKKKKANLKTFYWAIYLRHSQNNIASSLFKWKPTDRHKCDQYMKKKKMTKYRGTRFFVRQRQYVQYMSAYFQYLKDTNACKYLKYYVSMKAHRLWWRYMAEKNDSRYCTSLYTMIMENVPELVLFIQYVKDSNGCKVCMGQSSWLRFTVQNLPYFSTSEN